MDLTDLHGDTYIRDPTNFSLSSTFPKVFTENSKLIMDRDTTNNIGFILVRFNNGKRGYIIYSNYVYVYGMLTHKNYNETKDIRHVNKRNSQVS